MAVSAREVADLGISEGNSSVLEVAHAVEVDGDVLRLDEALLRRSELAIADGTTAPGLLLDLDLVSLSQTASPDPVFWQNSGPLSGP